MTSESCPEKISLNPTETLSRSDNSVDAFGSEKSVVRIGSDNSVVRIGSDNSVVRIGSGNSEVRIGSGESVVRIGSRNSVVRTTLGWVVELEFIVRAVENSAQLCVL